jgi:hypothetical protein
MTERHDSASSPARDPVVRNENEYVVDAAASSTGTPAADPSPAAAEPRGSTVSLTNLLMCAALSLLMGLGGAWIYHAFLGETTIPDRPEQATESRNDSGSDSARFVERLDNLSGQVVDLGKRVDAIPKPRPAPDLKPIEEKLAKLETDAKESEARARRLDGIAGKVEKVEKDLGNSRSDQKVLEDFQSRIAGLEGQVESIKKDVKDAKKSDGAKQDAAKPSALGDSSPGGHEMGGPPGPVLGPGVKSFEQGDYREAFEYFNGLTTARLEDARIWYLAALSRGLSTGQWDGETERLARRGADLEKAGTPQKALIDSALANLTVQTGKDWIAFFRRVGR